MSFASVLDVVGRSANPEYEAIGPLWGNLFAALRLSLGDFDFTQIVGRRRYLVHVLFWVVWIMMVGFAALIFLNFIIAEVSSSYARCNASVYQTIFKERAMQIAEAEDLYGTPERARAYAPEKFPKYIICRQTENAKQQKIQK